MLFFAYVSGTQEYLLPLFSKTALKLSLEEYVKNHYCFGSSGNHTGLQNKNRCLECSIFKLRKYENPLYFLDKKIHLLESKSEKLDFRL